MKYKISYCADCRLDRSGIHRFKYVFTVMNSLLMLSCPNLEKKKMGEVGPTDEEAIR